MGPPGCSAPARKRLILGALYRCTPKGLAKLSGFGEALDRQIESYSRPPAGMADPPFEAGFALWGAGVSASRKQSRARSGFRAQRESAPGWHEGQRGRYRG